MKKIVAQSVLVIILGLVAVVLYSTTKQTPGDIHLIGSEIPNIIPGATQTPDAKINGNPTNFAYEGTITFTKQGARVDVPQFAYLENGVVQKTEILLFDELSACAASNGSQTCLAFDVPLDLPFNNKKAVIEGVRIEGGVLVRKLMVVVEGDHAHKPPLGRVFVSWPQAREIITSCGVKTVMQNHDLDVSLHMKDATMLVAVEPVIDEVMRVVESAQTTCGIIPVL